MLAKIARFDGLIALLLGALATLGFAPFSFWPAPVIAIAGLLWLCADRHWKRAALLGWLFGFAHFATGIYWVVISTHVYGGAPLWLGLLLAAVLFAYMAVYPALVCALSVRFQALRFSRGWLLVPALWVLGELLRGWIFTGFPWLSLGYIALDTPAQRLAPVLGMHGLSLVYVISAFAIFRISRAGRKERVLALLMALLPLAGVLAPQVTRWTQSNEQVMNIAVVQGNVPQDQKWDPTQSERVLTRYRQMTLSAADADLIVWPEVVPNAPLDQMGWYLDPIHEYLKFRDSTLLGGVLIRGEGNTIFNSMIAMGAREGRYDKRHLVPFGEFFPIPDWLRPIMDVLGTPYSDFSSGGAALAPIEVRGQRIGISICFEDVFGAELSRESKQAAILVNATNDAWFAGSSAPGQHLRIARMRALENGRWLIRAANTGISALIAPDGSIAASSPFGATEVLRGEITGRAGHTPYSHWRDKPLWIMGFAALLIGIFLSVRERRRDAQN